MRKQQAKTQRVNQLKAFWEHVMDSNVQLFQVDGDLPEHLKTATVVVSGT